MLNSALASLQITPDGPFNLEILLNSVVKVLISMYVLSALNTEYKQGAYLYNGPGAVARETEYGVQSVHR